MRLLVILSCRELNCKRAGQVLFVSFIFDPQACANALVSIPLSDISNHDSLGITALIPIATPDNFQI